MQKMHPKLTYETINFIEQRPFWETASHSASKEIYRLLWYPKGHFRVRKNPQLVPILSQMTPVHTLRPIQPPVQWVPGVLSLGVKRQGREAEHSPASSVEVKIAWSYTSTPTTRLHGVVLS